MKTLIIVTFLIALGLG